MNPLEALQLIMNAAALAAMTKRDHIQVGQAGQVLQATLAEMAELKKAADLPKPKDGPKAVPEKKG